MITKYIETLLNRFWNSKCILLNSYVLRNVTKVEFEVIFWWSSAFDMRRLSEVRTRLEGKSNCHNMNRMGGEEKVSILFHFSTLNSLYKKFLDNNIAILWNTHIKEMEHKNVNGKPQVITQFHDWAFKLNRAICVPLFFTYLCLSLSSPNDTQKKQKNKIK